MPRRPCLACGRPVEGTRCPGCTPPRPSAHARGYGRTHQQAAAAAITAEPWCHTPGGCPWPDAGTPANPLTGDHVVPLARGGSSDPSNYAVLCKRCNSGKRDR